MKQRTNYKNIKKLGLCIIAFEATELLYNIISELRDSVDYVSLGLQKVSYHGDRMSAIDLAEIYRLRDEDKLIDRIVDVELDMKKEPRVQETDKRNILIQDAQDNGCTHCIVIDSDEYYTKKSFETACQLIDQHNYPITYCQYINYYHDYKHFLVYPFKDGMYVPFVTRVEYRHKYDCTDFPLPSDPTRRFVRPVKNIKKVIDGNGQIKEVKEFAVNYHIFPWNTVKMHHLSWIRADIRKKLNMWSSKKCFQGYSDLIDKAVYSFDNFDENCEKAMAKMLFNTPDNSVEVKAFPKQYIHPKVDYRTRLRPVPNYKKILFLSMSADLNLFNKLEEVSNETWRNVDTKKYKNIDVDFWTYTDAKEGEETHVDEKNHVIYVKHDYSRDAYQQTFSKTIFAIRELKNLKLDYDYIVRTNNSTWINIPLLNEFLAYQEDDSKIFAGRIYTAFWSAFNLYGGGELMIFSKRNIDILLEISKDPIKMETGKGTYDDNLLFGVWNTRLMRLKLPQTEYLHSLEDELLIDKNVPEDISFDRVAYQIKTYMKDGEYFPPTEENRMNYDIDKMYAVDKQFRALKKYDPHKNYLNLMENYYDKIIHNLPQNKKEWMSQKEEDIFLGKFKHTLPREGIAKYVNEKQKLNGYSQTII